MYDTICTEESLIKAFRSVKKNKGCAGIDWQSVGMFEKNLALNIRELSRLLKEKRYEPLPVRRTFIPKANGKQRPLGIPAVRDRVVQQAVLNAIQPILEPRFSDASYGFRPNRSALQAIAKIRSLLDEGYYYVVDADIKDFFGTLHHQILMERVRENIPDRDLTKLIYAFLTAGIMEEGRRTLQISGTPQGGIISPILANLYLTEFDRKMERGVWKLVRYADDYVVICKTANQAVQAFKVVRDLMAKLKLSLAEEKTRIADAHDGFDFLGYTIWKYGTTSLAVPKDAAMRGYKEKIRRLTRRQQPKNVKMIIEKLNPLIRGWGNYFRHGTVKKRFIRLDEWTRMRLRSFLAKKHSLTLNAHTKYPNSFFKESGLVFLTDLLPRAT